MTLVVIISNDIESRHYLVFNDEVLATIFETTNVIANSQ